MQKRYLLAGLAALVLLSGCANTVRTRTSTFMAPGVELGQGTVAVQPADAKLEGSLEFELYRSKLENRLQAEGYTIAAPESADYIARLGYQVEDTREERPRPRLGLSTRFGFGPYWMTGFGPYYPPFYRNRPDLFTYDPFFDPYPFGYRARFAYDPWGFGPYYRRHGWAYADPIDYRPAYQRTLSLSIARTPDTPAEKPQQVYEVKAASAGSCSMMSVVFDEMLAAIFHQFPGENGAVKTVRVEGETQCH